METQDGSARGQLEKNSRRVAKPVAQMSKIRAATTTDNTSVGTEEEKKWRTIVASKNGRAASPK